VTRKDFGDQQIKGGNLPKMEVAQNKIVYKNPILDELNKHTGSALKKYQLPLFGRVSYPSWPSRTNITQRKARD